MTTRAVSILDKSDVLDGLFAVWDDIDVLLAGLPEDQWHASSPLPGWDVQGLVAHIIGTESFLEGVAPPEPDVDVKALDHVRNDIGAMNECWVRHFDTQPSGTVLERYRAVTGDRRTVLEALSEEAWNTETMTPAGPESYGRFMRIRVFDCWMHEQDIRLAIQRPSTDAELEGAPSRLSLDEVGATLGFVVGKLAKAPDGSRIHFDLTGPLARSIRVNVEGRAAVVEDFGGQEPTATVRVDALQFTRLAGGRPMCPARPQDVELGGDAEVAARIVERLNFVI
jgi:uncharacterized protein (TIGR03083 family)